MFQSCYLDVSAVVRCDTKVGEPESHPAAVPLPEATMAYAAATGALSNYGKQMGKLGNQNSAGRAIRTENCLAGYFVSDWKKPTKSRCAADNFPCLPAANGVHFASLEKAARRGIPRFRPRLLGRQLCALVCDLQGLAREFIAKLATWR
jgi:hypothetical protein